MSIQTIIETEQTNEGLIYLYLEGSFWKAYEKSAFYFAQTIKEYKIKKRYVKAISTEIVSLGFPNSAIDAIKKGQEVTESSEKRLVIKITKEFCESDFSNWKSRIEFNSGLSSDREKILHREEDEILRAIKEYTLETKTPMESMFFLSELKKRILSGSTNDAI